MLATWLDTHIRRVYQTFDMPLGIVALLAVYLDVGDVAGGAEGDEHHHVVRLGDRVALGGDVRYLYPFEQGEVLALSAHI